MQRAALDVDPGEHAVAEARSFAERATDVAEDI
jgi:hypothetical protein